MLKTNAKKTPHQLPKKEKNSKNQLGPNVREFTKIYKIQDKGGK